MTTPRAWSPQQYAPDSLAGRTYYEPSRHGAEARYAERSERIRAILGRGAGPASTALTAPAGTVPDPAAVLARGTTPRTPRGDWLGEDTPTARLASPVAQSRYGTAGCEIRSGR